MAVFRRHGREFAARFFGSSMEPTIPSGTEVLLHCGSAVTPSDVVALIREDRVLVHRLMARSQDGGWILTRGDSRLLPDLPVTDPEAVIGRVIRVRRGDAFVDLAPLPQSLPQRLALGVCLLALGRGPSTGRAFIGLLHLLHRWLVLVPKTLLRRLWPHAY